MKKEILKRIGIGVLGGIVISYLITIGISLILGDGNYYPCVPSLVERFGSEIAAVIIQTILSAILGGGFAGSSFIWDKDDWSLLKQTGIYFSIVTVLMMTVAYFLDWMEHSISGVLSYFVIFLVIFVIVWISQYIMWKKRIARINDRFHGKN
ncbi:MAG: DUF3021 domain-containing protein [Lachnospiraceae bacterium]